ncbi:MAG TPA: hypothetical protein VF665_02635 [Longimicrobium sp.]|uniref:DUF4097 family beta strand repeat-containing protein n=1 Tax=Longimicrobium sp. TaxID=2029185 RepID=UPI002EDB870F
MRVAARLLPLAAALAFAVPGHAQTDEGCRNWSRYNNGDNDRRSFCEVRESRMPANGSLTVDAGTNGGVSVRAYEGREVVVRSRVQTYARTDEDARELARAVRVNASGSTITASGPSTSGMRGRSWAVSYEIMVPARTSLTLDTHNGPIRVEGVAGTMRLRATNGPLNLVDVSGDVNGRTTNGPVNVTLAGRAWRGGGLDVQTTNGPVSVRIPRGYGAHLRASTVHGPIRVPSSMRRRGDDDDNRRPWSRPAPVDMELNGGGPPIRAVTTNGPVTITEI